MALHRLAKIVRRRKRVGRGIGSRGAKSGRGQKGQKSRAGHKSKPGFEGGQTPLYMRLPKGRGTKQIFRPQGDKPVGIGVRQLKQFTAGSIVSPVRLREAGLIGRHDRLVKLIGNSPLSAKLTVRVHAVSAAAKQVVEAAGGSVELIPRSKSTP